MAISNKLNDSVQALEIVVSNLEEQCEMLLEAEKVAATEINLRDDLIRRLQSHLEKQGADLRDALEKLDLIMVRMSQSANDDDTDFPYRTPDAVNANTA